MKRHGQDITSYERKYLIEHQKPLDYFKQTFYIERSKNNYELYYETSQESMQDKLLLMDKICKNICEQKLYFYTEYHYP